MGIQTIKTGVIQHLLGAVLAAAASCVSASGSGLIGHYTFDDGGFDSSPMSNHAALAGAVIVGGGVYGNACEFDGTNDYVVVPHLDEMLGSQFTVSAWALSHDPDVALERAVFGKHREHDNVSYYWLNQYGQNIYGTMVGGSYGYFQSVTTSVSGVLNEWGMLTLTYDGAVLTLYKNGAVQDSTPVSGYAGNTYDLLIGAGEFRAFASGVQRWWDGLIDDVRIYNRALSASEVLALYGSDTNLTAAGGAVTCVMEPQGALDAGARWRIASESTNAWRVSGATAENLVPGTCQIVFRDAPGWIQPAPVFVTVGPGMTTDVTVTYNRANEDGLVLWFDFNDPGTVVEDRSGNGHDGAVFGAVYSASGYAGGAYEFNGSTDYIRVKSAPALQSTQFTVLAWARSRDAVVSLDRAIFGKHRERINQHYYWLYQNVLGQMQGTMVGSMYGAYRHVTGSMAPFINNWGHVGLTYDGSLMSLYINGALVDQEPVPGYQGNGYDLLVGAGEWGYSSGVPQRWWNGWIDELKIYNRALSPGEVSMDFNGTTNPPAAKGAVICTLTPPGAAEAGAGWRLSSEGADTSHASGYLVEDVPAGSVQIVFHDVLGWTAPAPQNIAVLAGQTTAVTAAYSYASTNRLVLYFPFDEYTGNAVADHSGYGNHGSAHQVTFEPLGYQGGCYAFNGTNSYVVVPDDDSYDILEFTISMWAKSRENIVVPGAIDRGILGKHREHYNVSYYWIYQHSNLVWSTMIGNQSGQFKNIYDVSPLYDTWGLVTLTYDGSTMSLYLNGSRVGTQAVSGYTGNPYDLLVGAGEWNVGMSGPQRMWNGWIDEVKIYSYAMNSNEVASLYAGEAPVDVILPVIDNILPPNRHVTTRSGVEMQIWASDNIGIADVTVNGFPAESVSGDKWSYRQDVLDAFSNSFEVVVRDVFGNTATRQVWYYRGSKLKLKARWDGVWEVMNSNAIEVPYQWDVFGQSESGEGVVPAHGKVLFETSTGPKTVRLFVDGSLQDMQAWNPKPQIEMTDAAVPSAGKSSGVNEGGTDAYGALRWRSVTGQVYTVSFGSNLVEGAWSPMPGSPVTGDGEIMEFTTAVPFIGHIFYQVEISSVATNL